MFDKVEPEARHYLKQVMRTIFIGLFWMFAQVIAGIFFEFGFVDGGLSTANIIYYTIFVITLVALIFYFVKVWQTKLPL
jgi:hypothetical protein